MQCFDENLLLELAEGTVQEDALIEVERHVDACAACRRAMAEVMRNDVDEVDGEPNYSALQPVDPTHYVLAGELARGGMGRIRLARDRRLGRVVALKETLPGADASRFEREARITARLQHPSIVNVHEAGVWPSGEPFYAMTRVAGRSLDEVVNDAKRFEARLALLPNVLAVADAMAFAHAEGIIHRDLKPKNVLVGSFGETVVIDWGLAKDLSEPDDSPSGIASSAPADETVLGTVVGTPAYMPPEQAQGLAVDTRADVYAIGAMLDHLLSGNAPYGTSSAHDTLEQVRRGPPVPLRRRQPGVPPELLTIVERAMARDASARYPSARELAEDLRRYQTGQLVGAHRYSMGQLVGRWVRKYRTAVGVAAVAGGLLLGFGVLAVQRIITAQHLAEQGRGDAEDLLGFMLVDLRTKLQPLGRLELLDDVAKKAVTYYHQRGEGLTAAELGKQALARQNLGEVLFLRGHTEGALTEYRAAASTFDALAVQDPTNDEWQRERGRNHGMVGEVLLAQGDAAGALSEYEASRGLQVALLARTPGNRRLRQHLSVSQERIGRVLLAQGDLTGALVQYRAAQETYQALTASDPSDTASQRDLARADDLIGDALLTQGNAVDALAAYEASRAVRQQLVLKDPRNTDWQHDLSVSQDEIGVLLMDRGDTGGALKEYTASLAITEKLARQDPSNTELQSELAISHAEIGDVLSAREDWVGALEAYQASLQLRARLAASDPTNADRQRALSIGHEKVGDALVARNELAGALVEFRAALSLRETLLARDPTNAGRQQDLSATLSRVGTALRAQRDVAGALQAFRAALAIDAALVAKDPVRADLRRNLSVSQAHMGDALLAQGDRAGALEAMRSSLALREVLAAQDPTNARRQEELTESHDGLGRALIAQGALALGVAELRAALAIATTLSEADPGPRRHRDLSDSHEKLGDALLSLGDKGQALAEFRAGLVLRQALAAKAPDDAELGKSTADLLHKVSTCCGVKRTP